MKTMIIAAALVAALAVPAVRAAVTLTHVHGLAYTADGKRLLIPSHHGLAVYENGEWSRAPGPRHDYMGFSATAKRLYSSGHSAPGSGLVNPFGLIRSDDGGGTWRKLALEGETDFHVLATSWNTNAVYVWNPAPSSRIKRPGLHYTLNDGFVWKPARAAGLDGDPRAIAVHPDNPNRVAVATSSGIFQSSDSGDSFRRVAAGQGTSACAGPSSLLQDSCKTFRGLRSPKDGDDRGFAARVDPVDGVDQLPQLGSRVGGGDIAVLMAQQRLPGLLGYPCST